MPPRKRDRLPKLNKPSKAERRASRSRGGFLFAAVVAVGALAASLWCATAKKSQSIFQSEKEDKRRSQDVRQRLASKPLVYSEHAACRMDCRHVTRADVRGALERGQLDDRRSTPKSRPCPRYALQDGRTLAVFADCIADTRVVTVIDTETDHPCGPC